MVFSISRENDVFLEFFLVQCYFSSWNLTKKRFWYLKLNDKKTKIQRFNVSGVTGPWIKHAGPTASH